MLKSKKTTRLIELPFDPYEDSGLLRKIKLDNKQLSFWFKVWHWHSKRYIEPWYPNNIGRLFLRIYQRLTKGYCYKDFWSLDIVLARFILPRLIEFRRRAADPNIMSGYPIDLDPCFPGYCEDGIHQPHDNDIGHKRWLIILDDMIYAFEEIVLDADEPHYNTYYQTDKIRKERGLKYFSEYFENLWE